MEGVGTRFELELEFMNCLASPEYLHCEFHFLTMNAHLISRVLSMT